MKPTFGRHLRRKQDGKQAEVRHDGAKRDVRAALHCRHARKRDDQPDRDNEEDGKPNVRFDEDRRERERGAEVGDIPRDYAERQPEQCDGDTELDRQHRGDEDDGGEYGC